jgi:hypothetical protein
VRHYSKGRDSSSGLEVRRRWRLSGSKSWTNGKGGVRGGGCSSESGKGAMQGGLLAVASQVAVKQRRERAIVPRRNGDKASVDGFKVKETDGVVTWL